FEMLIREFFEVRLTACVIIQLSKQFFHSGLKSINTTF
ncbi:uncharacterized protein METZ01_LOCUS259272, partial [marine metagenome]